ncbi:serine/threonine-protein kinase [uncultured Microbacterium sp.]|uniref:serine/threonine-protein kinase n=1 Tax=uncultured Microbacterium sp. TaxID=191216 RepID=UPI0025EB9743|nr:serine/threonine-protein kinase [uncultured Microbacterium sp.]
MSHSPDVSMPHPGDILGGRYILRERIGAGGMGRVFRARDEVLARDVAIKIFFADATDEPEPLRRVSEAQALAALDHPSLVTLYDARLTGTDHVYLVMELIDGPSLQRRIESGPLTSSEVAGIVSDLASALAVVHDAGIVHRDVKPSNVLLRPMRGAGRDVEAVLADFGVARLIGATRLTTPGTIIGTAAYLAPEQVRGEVPQAASDVYALGLLAIEALTRLHPFGDGTLQETLLARLARQPDVPRVLSPEWRALLTSMTAFDPAERPSAAAVVARVAALTRESSTDVVAAPSSAPSWAMPTALLTAPVAASAAPASPASGATRVSSEADDDRFVTAPPVAAAVGAGETMVPTSRPRRMRRRTLLWAGAAASAALIVSGHVMAFSLGDPSGTTTDRVSTPAPTGTPLPSSTPGSVVAEDRSVAVAPVVKTDAEFPPRSSAPGIPSPTQPAPVQSVGDAPGGTGSGSTDSVAPSVDLPAPQTTAPVDSPAPAPDPTPSPLTTVGAVTPGPAGPGPGNSGTKGPGSGKAHGNGRLLDAPSG